MTQQQRAGMLTDRSPLALGLRSLIVVLGVVAEVWNLTELATGAGALADHFAYFTIHTNLLVIIVLGWAVGVPPARRPAWFDPLRGAMTTYIVLTGILYNLLLAAPGELFSWAVHPPNLLQHRIIPILVALDWLLIPTVRRLRLSRFWIWLAYPVGYLAFTLIRGPLVGDWYPYFFLDPNEFGGYAGLLVPIFGLVVVFAVGAFVVCAVGVARYRPVRVGSSSAVPR
ncbi:Pr6Pr family membrane protein [Occultella kanbiaonis]|uniref:Pr6Pr family membrane protein n=1 Tax=Occultella kanbiaonis TaxID=2675754 RepID=UPI0013D2ABF0|nr:Pr6Pr family membrane protein [Occultella kanbiaonis]